MKAIIFSAGLGSRLKPYTNNKPKALVKVLNRPLIEHALLTLQHAGIRDIIINVHHYSEQMIRFAKHYQNSSLNIQLSDESKQLRDTGGGIKQAAWFFDAHQPFLAYNVDILTNLDIQKMVRKHKEEKALATLAVRQRDTSRYLLFNAQQHLKGWKNTNTQEQLLLEKGDLHKRAFSGIQVINPEILAYMPEKQKFSVIETYLNLCNNHKILAYEHDNDYWFDVGTPEKLQKAEDYLMMKSGH